MKKAFLLSLVIIMLGPGCQNPPENKPSSITVVTYGGGTYHESHLEAFIRPYQKLTGIDVNSIVWGAEYGKLKAMIESGKVDWDVVEVTDAQFKRGKKEGFYTPLTQFPDSTGFLPGTIDSFGVANVYWTTVLAYSKQAFPVKQPATWADFWDVKTFPGRRALYDDPRGNLEFALLADGVAKDSLYPLDVARAFRKLDQIKPFIKLWWKDGTQPVQLLNEHSVDLCSAWNGRIFALGNANKDIAFSWNGAVSELDWWVVPKGAINTVTASRFISFVSEPDRMAAQARIVGYGPVNLKALDCIPDSTRKLLPTYPRNWDVSFVINSEWWSDNESEMMKKWLEWKSK